MQYVSKNAQINTNGNLAPTYPQPEVFLVFLKTWATEGADRTTLLPYWNATDLVETVAANYPNTVVIAHSSGLSVLRFADSPDVTAMVAAHFGAQEAGNRLIVDMLYGSILPSGHLSYTIPLEEDDS